MVFQGKHIQKVNKGGKGKQAQNIGGKGKSKTVISSWYQAPTNTNVQTRKQPEVAAAVAALQNVLNKVDGQKKEPPKDSGYLKV